MVSLLLIENGRKMNSFKARNSLISLLLIALLAAFPGAYMAQATLPTTTTLEFIIDPSTAGLSITVPTNAHFDHMETPEFAETRTVELSAVTVSDTRWGALIRTWTTNAISTNLVTGSDSMTASSLGYSSGPSITISGTVGVTEFTRTSMNTSAPVETGASSVGKHVVSWTPMLSILVPASKAAGTYVGVLTHSVF